MKSSTSDWTRSTVTLNSYMVVGRILHCRAIQQYETSLVRVRQCELGNLGKAVSQSIVRL